MTVIGIDDTDSRTTGMCTTYVAHRIAHRLRTESTVERCLLIRLNPAIEHKTRGNAALAIQTLLPATQAFVIAREEIHSAAVTSDPHTNPGLVVTPDPIEDIPEPIADFARTTMRDSCTIDDARALIDAHDYLSASWNNGRGRIGALAAIGASSVITDWTYELIAYRSPDRWGTPRDVDPESVFAAATTHYPDAWDTVDRTAQELVCVPRTPGPVLYGLRGDTPAVLTTLAAQIASEPVESTELFQTNQGTDAHLHDDPALPLSDAKSYRVTGTVTREPTTRQGGHVFFTITTRGTKIDCCAFEPTKRFRTHVRRLRPGDRITACGEVRDGTLKLEKFAVRELTRTEQTTPTCPDCGNTMESAGANQGYRCKPCGTHAPQKTERPLDRSLELGWYEVPPRARRHIAKPLVRGGFDAPTHPER